MLIIWNGSQVKTEAPVIKNNVFANLASLMTLLWLHIGDFCFLQITKYATHITNRGVAGKKLEGILHCIF